MVRVGNFWNNNYIEYESSGNRHNNLSVKKPYLRDAIINLQKSNMRTIHLIFSNFLIHLINLIFSKDVDEQFVLHSTSSNIELYDNANEVANQLFESLLSRYQIGSETSMRSNFIFDSVQLLPYKCHKINFKYGRSYIDSADWMKKKKATINPTNDDDKCFQHAITITSNFEEIKKGLQRFSNIKPFLNNHSHEGINYPSKIEDWKRLKKIIILQLLTIFYILKKKKYVLFILEKLTQL